MKRGRRQVSQFGPSRKIPFSKQSTHNFHANRCEKNGEEIGSLVYYCGQTPLYQLLSLYIITPSSSNPSAHVQTKLFFSSFSLSTIRILASIRLSPGPFISGPQLRLLRSGLPPSLVGFCGLLVFSFGETLMNTWLACFD